MKAMIWKELRENFKWALLALLVLTIAEFYALSSSRSDTENLYNELTRSTGRISKPDIERVFGKTEQLRRAQLYLKFLLCRNLEFIESWEFLAIVACVEMHY